MNEWYTPKKKTIKELEGKIALYEEYERQKKVGLGLICADPRFGMYDDV